MFIASIVCVACLIRPNQMWPSEEVQTAGMYVSDRLSPLQLFFQKPILQKTLELIVA